MPDEQTKLRAFLRKFKIRQTVCAEGMGISKGYFCEVVNGQVPSPQLAEQICVFLNSQPGVGEDDRLGEMDILFPHRPAFQVIDQ